MDHRWGKMASLPDEIAEATASWKEISLSSKKHSTARALRAKHRIRKRKEKRS